MQIRVHERGSTRSVNQILPVQNALPKKVVFMAPRFPEISGGATYVRNMCTALEGLGIDTEVWSLFPGEGVSSHKAFVIVQDKELHSRPIIRGRATLGAKIRSLPKFIWKKIDWEVTKRRYKTLVASLGESDVVIFTHMMCKQMSDRLGYVPSERGPILIGQHHSQYESLEAEVNLRETIERSCQGLSLFTVLTDIDAVKFSHLVDVPVVSVSNPHDAATVTVDVASKAKVAVALARFSPEKRIDLMIKMFVAAISEPTLKEWRLEIFGDGPLKGDLEMLISHLGVEDSVRLMGTTDKVAEVFSAASLNLLTSEYEGFGMVILEAAAMGVPSVAFNCSAGVAEQMEDGRGFLVKADDVDDYVSTLQDAMASEGERARRGARARDHSARYSSSAISERWQYLLQLASERRTRPEL